MAECLRKNANFEVDCILDMLPVEDSALYWLSTSPCSKIYLKQKKALINIAFPIHS